MNLERFSFKRYRQVSAQSQPRTAQVWVLETWLLVTGKNLGVLLCRVGGHLDQNLVTLAVAEKYLLFVHLFDHQLLGLRLPHGKDTACRRGWESGPGATGRDTETWGTWGGILSATTWGLGCAGYQVSGTF